MRARSDLVMRGFEDAAEVIHVIMAERAGVNARIRPSDLDSGENTRMMKLVVNEDVLRAQEPSNPSDIGLKAARKKESVFFALEPRDALFELAMQVVHPVQKRRAGHADATFRHRI